MSSYILHQYTLDELKVLEDKLGAKISPYEGAVKMGHPAYRVEGDFTVGQLLATLTAAELKAAEQADPCRREGAADLEDMDLEDDADLIDAEIWASEAEREDLQSAVDFHLKLLEIFSEELGRRELQELDEKDSLIESLRAQLAFERGRYESLQRDTVGQLPEEPKGDPRSPSKAAFDQEWQKIMSALMGEWKP
jgi:hypothetical protein